jgi:outer membrane protein assembly factor BamB
MPRTAPVLALTALMTAAAHADGAPPAPDASAAADASAQWPTFRGHRARGIASGPTPPTSWNVEDGTNIRWKAAVPGMGHSSPVLWGDRLFVTTAVPDAGETELASLYGSPGYGAGESVASEGVHAFRLYCLDRKTGAVRWHRDAAVGVPKAARHPKSSHANPTPACDAERVVAFFGSEGLHCYDHAGKLLWSRDFGVLDSGAPGYGKEGYQWGFASSPVLHDGRVVVQCDVENDSFLAVLDARDGSEIWRVARDEDSTWGTPTVHETGADGRPQVIVNGYKHMGGYDLATGAEIWTLAGGGDVPVPTPIVVDELIYLTNAHGRMRPICAIRTDARGPLTLDPDECAAMVWCHPRKGIYMQTPIVVGDALYACSDGGILECFDAATGAQRFRARLGSGGSGFSGSAIAVGDVLYFTSEHGSIHVVRAGPKLDVIAVNDMGETCMSTPAAADGVLYVRGRRHLFAIGADD